MVGSYFYSILKHAPKVCAPVSAGFLLKVVSGIVKQGELAGWDTVALFFGISFAVGGAGCCALNRVRVRTNANPYMQNQHN